MEHVIISAKSNNDIHIAMHVPSIWYAALVSWRHCGGRSVHEHLFKPVGHVEDFYNLFKQVRHGIRVLMKHDSGNSSMISVLRVSP